MHWQAGLKRADQTGPRVGRELTGGAIANTPGRAGRVDRGGNRKHVGKGGCRAGLQQGRGSIQDTYAAQNTIEKRNSIIIKGGTVSSVWETNFQNKYIKLNTYSKQRPYQPDRPHASCHTATGQRGHERLIHILKTRFSTYSQAGGIYCFEVVICSPVFQKHLGRLRYPGYLLCLVANLRWRQRLC
jgi:hypothetical protein